MVVPKKSSTIETTTAAKCQHSVTPSKIPRPDSRKDTSLSDFLKPSSAAPRTAVFDLNGRIVKKSSSKDDCPVAVQTAEATANKEILCVQSEPLAITDDHLLRQQVSQEILQRDGSVTIRTIKTVSLDNSTTATLTEISNKPPSSFLVGDNSFDGSTLQISQSQAIFNYIHEENNMPSSTSREGDRVQKIASRCSFVNICEKECSDRKPKRGFPWAAFWNGIMALMIVLLLAITLLVNYHQLMAIWYGYELKKDLTVPIEESYFEKWANFLLRFWMDVKNFIVLDELNDEL
ncbi:uncharacterized protein LOC135698831 [Ochlerotatus camptorhynchus]|uniref:uncharacterized protein LOC135698831 n=1 Tax=Ochlerotatus camptorhynchus TaxID=644619 RepID=UPI0031DB544E